MVFGFANATYRVRFEYDNGSKRGRAALSNIHKKRIVTSACVEVKTGTQTVTLTDGAQKQVGVWTPLAVGDSVRDKHDIFNKGKGRRKALGRATCQLGNKALQRAVWDAYFDNHRDGVELMIAS